MNTNRYSMMGVTFKDPALAKAMSRTGYLPAEARGSRNNGGALVLPRKPEPVLIGVAAASVEEYA